VNLLEDRAARTLSSTHHFELQRYHLFEVKIGGAESDELTIIDTGASEVSVSADGSHSSKVRPEASFSTLVLFPGTLPELPRHNLGNPHVTINSSSVQKVCLVRVQPCTMRFGPQELDPCPRPRTREHAVHQQLYDLLA
jgi:hypothetical protein